MIEQQLADRFRDAVADEPPLGFDPDDVVDRAALRQRRRLAVAGASAGTVALALATVAVAGLPTGSGVAPAPVGAQPPVETVVTATPNAPSPLGDVDAVTSKLEQVAPQVIAEHAPALKTMLSEQHAWRTEGGQTVTGAAIVFGSPGPSISVGVLHGSAAEKETGIGAAISDTTNPDGSHTRVYLPVYADGERGLIVQRTLTNGVVISVGAPEALNVPQGALVAMANDERLRF